VAGIGLGSLALLERPARACGGFFCNTVPVVQTGEGIVFGVDPSTNTVQAIINISYQGSATDFAWVLPLQSAPSKIDIGPESLFTVVNQLTAPSFQISKYSTDGICSSHYYGFGGAEDTNGGPVPAAPGTKSNTPGVDVVEQSTVGPYDSVVLKGTDPAAIHDWLVQNNYNVTDAMMKVVTPYVAQGDVLLALKLQKDQPTGAIQPVALTMSGNEACIPIRLTAIAAQDNMDIMALVLTNEGRAIPKNFYHVDLNFARLNWLQGGNDYRQLVIDAAKEGGGNAFTTEFAGAAGIFKEKLYKDGQYDEAKLRTLTDLAAFLQELSNEGLRQKPELKAIITSAIPAVAACPTCSIQSFQGQTVDPGPIVDQIDARIVKPEQSAQALLDTYGYATRLYTLISPPDMNVDPIFSYDAKLPDVTNVHTAQEIAHCGIGGYPGSAGVDIVLDDGTRIAYDNNGNPDMTLLQSMPAATKVEQLAQGLVVKDNTQQINQILNENNSRNSAGCGCSSEKQQSTASIGAFALIGLVMLFRRRR
jgi:MYXO-CTERM domain-containing protein